MKGAQSMKYTTPKNYTSSMKKIGYDSVSINTEQEYETLYGELQQKKPEQKIEPLEYRRE